MLVEPVSSGQDLDEFIDLPARLYAEYPGFEPPLRMDRKMLLDPRQSAFWKRARAQYWLARRDGQVVGRISAQVDPVMPVGIEPGAGMFGCIDARDDREAIAALVQAAEDWLKEQGCSSMFGPCTLDMNDEPGLLVEGSEQPPMTLCPWHPPYLGAHLETFGLVKLRDLHSWRRDLAQHAPSAPDNRLRLAERIPGLTIRYLERRHLARDLQILCDVYNDGWQDHWGFIPLTLTDLYGLDQLIRWFVPKEAFKIVELAGKPIGVMLLVPNFFELTHGLAPRPTAAGWMKLLWRAARHRFTSGRIIVVGVARELQATVVGGAVAALLVDELIAGQTTLQGKWVEAGWVLENNSALVRILERFEFERNKTFRIYSKTIMAPDSAG